MPGWLRPVLSVLTLAVLTAAILLVMLQLLPPGTTLAGVSVDDDADLASALEQADAALSTTTLRLTTPAGTAAEVTGAELGLAVDRAGTLDAVSGPDRLEAWIGRLAGEPLHVELAVEVRDRARLAALRDELEAPAVDAAASTTASGLEVTPPQEGFSTDPAALAEGVERAIRDLATDPPSRWPTPVQIAVAGTVTPPELGWSDLDAAADAYDQLTRGSVQLRGPDGRALTLTAADLRAMAVVDEQLRVDLSPERASGRLLAFLAGITEAPSVEAHVEDRSPVPPRGSSEEEILDVQSVTGVVVVDSVDGGYVPDRAATVAAVAAAMRAGLDSAEVVGTSEEHVTAEALGITVPVSTFTTYYTAGQSRVTNIQRIAEIVDGTVIAPGAHYELNHAVGPRTVENGFTLGGAIIDGELVTDIGGGVSQFATTFFNAAWFAGMDLLTHQPHSFYFSRYPPGREATINYPNVDLEIANSTPYAVLVDTETTANSVTVTFWSTPYWDVETFMGPRLGDGVSFRIDYARERTAPDGTQVPRDEFTHIYRPPPPPE